MGENKAYTDDLYKKLRGGGYNITRLGENEDAFYEKMGDPEYRSNIYDWVRRAGDTERFNLGSYNEYYERFKGLGKEVSGMPKGYEASHPKTEATTPRAEAVAPKEEQGQEPQEPQQQAQKAQEKPVESKDNRGFWQAVIEDVAYAFTKSKKEEKGQKVEEEPAKEKETKKEAKGGESEPEVGVSLEKMNDISVGMQRVQAEDLKAKKAKYLDKNGRANLFGQPYKLGDKVDLIGESASKAQRQALMKQYQAEQAAMEPSILRGIEEYKSLPGGDDAPKPIVKDGEKVWLTAAGITADNKQVAQGINDEYRSLQAENDAKLQTLPEQAEAQEKAIQEGIEKRREEIEQFQKEHLTGFGAAVVNAGPNNTYATDPQMTNYRLAQRHLDNVREAVEVGEGRKNGEIGKVGAFGKGVKDKAGDIGTWDFGFSGLLEAQAVQAALDKYQKGEKMSADEEALLNATALEVATKAMYKQQLSGAYGLGESLVDVADFMLTMALAGGMSGIGKGFSKKLANMAVKKFGPQLMKEFSPTVARNLLTTGAVVTRGVSDVANSYVLANTIGAMGTAANIMQRHQGSVSPKGGETEAIESPYILNPEGQRGFTPITYGGQENPVSLGTAIKKGETASALNYWMMYNAEFLQGVGGALAKGAGKAVSKWMPNELLAAIEKWGASPAVQGVERYAQKMHWQGAPSMYASMIETNTINALLVGDYTLDKGPETGVFNRDRLLQDAIMFGIIEGVTGVGKTLGFGAESYLTGREIKKARAEAGKAWQGRETQLDNFYKTLDSGTPDEVLADVKEMLAAGDLTREQLGSVLNLTRLKMNQRGMAQTYNNFMRTSNDEELRAEQMVNEGMLSGMRLATDMSGRVADDGLIHPAMTKDGELVSILTEEGGKVTVVDMNGDMRKMSADAIGRRYAAYTEKGASENSADAIRDAYYRYNYHRAEVMAVGGGGEAGEALLRLLDEDPATALSRARFAGNETARQVCMDYLRAKSEVQGIVNGRWGETMDAIDAAEQAIDAITDKSDGMVHSATLKNGEKVYVISRDGNTSVVADEQGRTRMVETSDIASEDGVQDARTLKRESRDALLTTATEEQQALFQGELSFEPGEEVVLLGKDGTTVKRVRVLGPTYDADGQPEAFAVMVENEDGSTEPMNKLYLQQQANRAYMNGIAGEVSEARLAELREKEYGWNVVRPGGPRGETRAGIEGEVGGEGPTEGGGGRIVVGGVDEGATGGTPVEHEVGERVVFPNEHGEPMEGEVVRYDEEKGVWIVRDDTGEEWDVPGDEMSATGTQVVGGEEEPAVQERRVGDRVRMLDDEGNIVEGVIQSVEGDSYIVRTDTPIDGDMVRPYSAEELDVAEKQVQEAEANESAGEGGGEQGGESALAQIPVDEAGNPDFEQAQSPAQAVAALTEMADGSVEDAREVAALSLGQAQSALKAVQKAKAKAGASVAETMANVKAQKEAVDEAQKKVDFWQGVVDEFDRPKEEETAEVEPETTTEEPEAETPIEESPVEEPAVEETPAEEEVATEEPVEEEPEEAPTEEGVAEGSSESGGESAQEAIEAAESEVETEPTQGQIEVGNYKKGHVKVAGYEVTIENPKGSVRRGVDAKGKPWETKMANTYGYIRGTEGADGDHIDVFLANDMDAWDGKHVYVVDQYNPDGTFDEHKVMLGFGNAPEAEKAYLANYEEGWEDGRRIDVSEVEKGEFDKWVESSHRKTKPFTEYKNVEKLTLEGEGESAGYSIEKAQYETKRGKVLDMFLLTPSGQWSEDLLKKMKAEAKELKGWYDREKGGFMMRSMEDAEALAKNLEESKSGPSPSEVQAAKGEGKLSIEEGEGKSFGVYYTTPEGKKVLVRSYYDEGGMRQKMEEEISSPEGLKKAADWYKKKVETEEKAQKFLEDNVGRLFEIPGNNFPRHAEIVREGGKIHVNITGSNGITFGSDVDDAFMREHAGYIVAGRWKPVDEEPELKKEGKTDRQGNPVDKNGKLITEKVKSIDDLTDEDFTSATRSVELPNIPENVDKAIGADGKPVIIKKNIFEQNKKRHPDVTPEQSRDILNAALYNPDLYGQNQKQGKPYNWVLIRTTGADGRNRLVLLEVNREKDNVEVVHWHFVDERGIEKIKKQAAREGGHLLILPSELAEEAGALSGRTRESLSEGKGTEKSGTGKEKGEKNAEELRERVNKKVADTKLSAEKAAKMNLKNFAQSAKGQNEALKCIYYTGGYAYISDGKKAIKVHMDYPKEYEGRAIDAWTGKEFGYNYPDVETVLKRMITDKRATKLKNEEVLRDIAVAKDLTKGKSRKGHPITGVAIALDAVPTKISGGYTHKRTYVDAAVFGALGDVIKNANNFEMYTTDEGVMFIADGLEGVVMPLGDIDEDVYWRWDAVVQDGKVYATKDATDAAKYRLESLRGELKATLDAKKAKKLQDEIDMWEKFSREAGTFDELRTMNADDTEKKRREALVKEFLEANVGKKFKRKSRSNAVTIESVNDDGTVTLVVDRGKYGPEEINYRLAEISDEIADGEWTPFGELDEEIAKKQAAKEKAAQTREENKKKKTEETIRRMAEQREKTEKEVTTALARYEEEKKKNPDAVLVFRKGDGYEIYMDDARAVSGVIGETPKRRTGAGGQVLEVITFPKEALETCLPKMIKAGHRVGIYDTEEAKKPSEMVTPGGQAEEPKKPATSEKKGKSAGEKIEDWGERIEGARKFELENLAKTLGNVTDENLMALPISKVFPRQDFAKQVQQGKLSEDDAIFLEAIQSLAYRTRKPSAGGRRGQRALESWVNDVSGLLSVMKAYCDAETPEERQQIREAALSNAEIIKEEDATKERIKELNPGREITVGSFHSETPIKVTMDLLQRLGYPDESVGKVTMPTIKARYDGTAYQVAIGDNHMGNFPTYEKALKEAVKLAKKMRGDDDVTYDKSDFRIVGEGEMRFRKTGKYSVEAMANGGVYNLKNDGIYRDQILGSKEEAEKYIRDFMAEAQEKGYRSPHTKMREEEESSYPSYGIELRDPLRKANDMKVEGLPKFDTFEDARAWMEENMGELNERTNETVVKANGENKGKTKKVPLSMYYEDRSRKTIKVCMKLSNGKYETLKGGFKSISEAQKWMEAKQSEIAEAYAKREAALRELKKESTFMGAVPRKGTDWRNGKDVTADEFGKKFGFRGVQFGNWTNQVDRQTAMNEAYDAFMDMAEVLGVSPEALSLNGELGIAFGSRGTGKANAHYEPGEVVINLTKTRGAGSLAHEWWHALDNYFSRQGGMALGMLTEPEKLRLNGNVRSEVVEAYRNLVDAINGSDYDVRSQNRGTYWGSAVEETARLFAEWVDKKLQDEGKKNSFLSSGKADDVAERFAKENYTLHKAIMGDEAMSFEDFKKSAEAYEGWPYPLDSEVRQFDAPMKALFDTIQEKREGGKAILFRKGRAEERSETSRRAGEMAVEALRKKGVEVVTDADEMLRVLDEARRKGRSGQQMLFADGKEIGVQYLKTADGEILGFVREGKVYIDPAALDANTPVHEYTHLWDTALRKSNPKLWQEGMELMKRTPLWEQVKNDPNYKDIAGNENLLASEVHSRLTGEEGRKYFEQLAKEADEAKGPFEKAEKISLLEQLRRWIDKALKWVKDKLFGKPEMTVEEFRDMPLKDLLSGEGEEGGGDDRLYRDGDEENEEEFGGNEEKGVTSQEKGAENGQEGEGHREGASRTAQAPQQEHNSAGRRGDGVEGERPQGLRTVEEGRVLRDYVGKANGVVRESGAPITIIPTRQALSDLAAERGGDFQEYIEDSLRRHGSKFVGYCYEGEPGIVAESILDEAGGDIRKAAEEVRRIVMHEGVAHRELPVMLGNAADVFYDKVFKGMSNEDKDKFLRYAFMGVLPQEIRKQYLRKFGIDDNKTWITRRRLDEVGRENITRPHLTPEEKRKFVEDFGEDFSRKAADEYVAHFSEGLVDEQLDYSVRNTESRLHDLLDRIYQKEVLTDKDIAEAIMLCRDMAARRAQASGEALERSGADDAERMAEDNEMLHTAMRDRVNEMVKELHLGGAVDIRENADGLKGRMARSKGWYDPRTGRMTIILSNNADLYDVEGTIFHEATTHHGLRAMLGKRFDSWLESVYGNVHKGARVEINALARKNGWNFRKATEEWLAKMSEDGKFLEAIKTGTWRKVRYSLNDMIRRLGFHVDIGDDELRYALWRSHQNLKEGPRSSILAQATDVAMQSKLQVGNFAPQEGRLLFRDRKETAAREQRELAQIRERMERRIASGWYQSIEALQDSMQSLFDFYRAVRQAQGKKWKGIESVRGFENAYLGENRLSSVVKNAVDDMEREYFDPMYDEARRLTRGGKAAEERLYDYLLAKHGMERNEYMAERYARDAYEKMAKEDAPGWDELSDGARERLIYKYRRDYAGLTALFPVEEGEEERSYDELMGRARAMVEEYEGEHETGELWKRINATNDAILRYERDCGMISPETYDKISSMYEYYIPLRGFDETTSDEVYAYINGRNTSYNSPMRTARGRKSRAANPFANMEQMAATSVMEGEKNRLVKQPFYNFVQNNPTDYVSTSELWLRYNETNGTWETVFPDLEGAEGAEIQSRLKAFDERMEELAAENPEMYRKASESPDIPYRVVGADTMREHQVIVRVNGKDVVLTVNGNPRLAQALNGRTNPDSPKGGVIPSVIRTAGNVNRWMSQIYTTYNPDFIVGNFARDMVYANWMAWMKESPLYAVRYNANFVRSFKNILKMVDRRRRGKLDMSDDMERLFEEFMKNGGETGYVRMLDAEEANAKAAKWIKNNMSAGTRRVCGKIFELVNELNRAVEMSGRFAAYMTSRNSGRDIARSIWDAKEITVNFNKKGAGDKFYGAKGQTKLGNVAAASSGYGRMFRLFFNVHLQGPMNFYRQAVRHPVKFAMAMMKPLLVGGFLAAFLRKDDDEYWDLPDFTRRQNVVKKIGDKTLFRWPLSHEQRPIWAIGEALGSCARGKEDKAEMAGDVAEAVFNEWPIDLVDSQNEETRNDWLKFAMVALTPSFIQPFVEARDNRSWTGQQLWKDTPFNKDMPQYTKVYKNTNQTLVNIARTLNKWTGGDSKKKGWVDMNPAAVEYVLNSTLPVSTLYNQVSNLWQVAKGEKEFDWRYVPLLNRFLATVDDERNAGRGVTSRYMNLQKKCARTRDLYNRYDKALERGEDDEDYGKLMGDLEKTREYGRMMIWKEFAPGIKENYDDYRDETLGERVREEAWEDMMGQEKECLKWVERYEETGDLEGVLDEMGKEQMLRMEEQMREMMSGRRK